MSEKEPKSYAPETILTLEQVAEWFQVSTDMVETMGFRCLTLGQGRKRRFLVRHILEDIEKQVAA